MVVITPFLAISTSTSTRSNGDTAYLASMFGIVALIVFIFLFRTLKKIISVFALDREYFLYFYRLDSEEQEVVKDRNRFQGIYLIGDEDFVADYEPNLTVLSQEDFLEELENIYQKDLQEEVKREIVKLKYWVTIKNPQYIGYQSEKN